MRQMHFARRYTTNLLLSRRKNWTNPRSFNEFFLDGDLCIISIARNR